MTCLKRQDWRRNIQVRISGGGGERATGRCGDNQHPVTYTKNMKNMTKARLIDEIRILQKRVNELQKSETISKQTLKDSDIEYRTLVENGMDGIYIINIEGFEYVNPAFEQILGYKTKELYNKDFKLSNIIHPDDGKLIAERTKAREKGKKLPSNYSFKAITKDGKTKYVEVNTIPLPGEKVRILGIMRDITDMKKAEEALRSSDKNFRDLVNSSPDGIIIADEKGKMIFVNTQISKITGYSRNELLKMTGWDMTHPEDIPKMKKIMIERLKNKLNKTKYEYILIHKDGSEVVTEFSNTTTLWQGKVRPMAIVRDITLEKETLQELMRVDKQEKVYLRKIELYNKQLKKSQEASINIMEDLSGEIEQRKQIEDMLRTSEIRYRSLFENSQNSITLYETVLDKNGKPADFIFLEVNRAFELQTGLKKKDIIGKKVTDVMLGTENGPANWIQRYGEEVLKGRNISFKNYYKHLKKWYSIVVYRPQENQIATIFTDITDRKKSELEIQQSRTQLRKLAGHLEDVREEERTIIARNIHDELGQLATALKMDVSWLQKQLPKENQQWIAKTQTISDLVDMTGDEIQRICSELRPGVLDDLGLEDALEWHVSEYNKRTGTVCKLSIEYDLARLNKHLSVAVYRMIQEALTNVRRHAKASKVTISITGKNGKLKLMIKDNGIGIKQEEIDDSKSFGLIGIEERALSMNGYSRISGKEGEGTTLEIMLGIGNSSL